MTASDPAATGLLSAGRTGPGELLTLCDGRLIVTVTADGGPHRAGIPGTVMIRNVSAVTFATLRETGAAPDRGALTPGSATVLPWSPGPAPQLVVQILGAGETGGPVVTLTAGVYHRDGDAPPMVTAQAFVAAG